MRYSILMSLFDRNPIDLAKTFQQLAKVVARRKGDTELCVVYDFPKGEHPEMVDAVACFREAVDGYCDVRDEHYPTIQLHPETFHLDGHNNPVAVNNKLMDMARGDNLVWISSDMIVTPFLLDRIDIHVTPEGVLPTVWCSRVIDQDSMAEYCGPSRLFPMMWCVAHARTEERHDLQLLQGFGFDDNDWMARMALWKGTLCIDLLHVAIHQTHGAVSQIGQLASGKAYAAAAAPGWERSTAYVRAKWGGVPFDGQTLDVVYGEIGQYLMLQVRGVKAGADYPLAPEAAAGKLAVPVSAPVRRKRNKKS